VCLFHCKPPKGKLNKLDLQFVLVENCKKGDRDAQFRLYRQYSKAMYNICLRMLKNKMDAEDILQMSFIDVFTKLDSFRYQSTVGAWIKRIVINNCINFLKKKKIYFEELDNQGHVEDESGRIPEDQLKIDRINEAIMQLADGYRVVLSLYLLEGYDHSEIAQILGISQATSKSQYSRAKKKIRDLLHAESA
jgi:RNA polymerase sigma-70 factor (ECF subfamily)